MGTLTSALPSDIGALAAAYAHPEGPWLRANMVVSLDGATTIDGHVGALTNPRDQVLLHLLRTLADEDGLTTGELARRSHMDPGAAVRQVKALEDDALVERSSDADDARVTVVSLTGRGRRVVSDIVEVRIEHLQQVLGDWPEADRRQLAELVDRLVDGLQSTPFKPHLKERT